MFKRTTYRNIKALILENDIPDFFSARFLLHLELSSDGSMFAHHVDGNAQHDKVDQDDRHHWAHKRIDKATLLVQPAATMDW